MFFDDINDDSNIMLLEIEKSFSYKVVSVAYLEFRVESDTMKSILENN